jgi:formylglycine-generating enzyme required for sulfatase activity
MKLKIPGLPAACLVASLLTTASASVPSAPFPLWDGKESVSTYARRAGIRDTELTLDLGGQVTMKLTLIPAGTFRMGSPETEKDRRADEGPAHEVTISKPFYMGVCEVTREQYERTRRKNPAKPLTDPERNLALHYITWDEAVAFCDKVSARTGRQVTLPTEAQWEYACRAGSLTRFYYGDDPEQAALGDYAWCAWDGTTYSTQPGGLKKTNAWGLYDLYGNAREWCLDYYSTSSYAKASAIDPRGPPDGDKHVVRGGALEGGPFRSAARNAKDSLHHYPFYGFRVVAALEASPPPSVPPVPPAPVVPLPLPTNLTNAAIALDLGDGVKMDFVLIPAGTFRMGSPTNEQDRCADEGPQREVTISQPFYMGVTEVTKAQYAAIMVKKTAPRAPALDPVQELLNESATPQPESSPAPAAVSALPVDSEPWNNVLLFCRKLSAKTGAAVQLPTEAQWEYACRAGSTTRFPYGDDPNYDQLPDYAWCKANSGGKPNPVGLKKPNAWGLYDMLGNQWEWCADWYADSYDGAGATNPAGPVSGEGHVLRGGSWAHSPVACRSAYRYTVAKDNFSNAFGFRVILALQSGRFLPITKP